MSFDWKSLVGTVAPSLANALGGPLAGMAVTAIAEAVGLEPGASETDVYKVLQTANPDMLLKLKEADIAFNTRMAELDIDLEKIAADDRANARNREIQTKDKTPRYLAYFIMAGFFGILVCVMFISIPKDGQAAFNILLGALTGLTLQIGNYIYGSSAGSDKKTELLGKK